MNTAPTYAIRVGGHLDDHWSGRLADLSITRSDDGTTCLAGQVADQAQLHGVLAALRDIGATILDIRTTGAASSASRAVLDRRLHTARLTLRPATIEDAEPTWVYRHLASVNEWLTGCPADLDGYREQFADPDRLATTVVVTLGHEGEAPVIGDFMLRRDHAWAQLEVTGQARGAQAELGWVLDPAYTGHGYATEAVRELLRYCFQDLGVHRVTANCFLDNDTSWRLMERVACAANCTQSASHCTGPADGSTRSATPSSKGSGRRPPCGTPPAICIQPRDLRQGSVIRKLFWVLAAERCMLMAERPHGCSWTWVHVYGAGT
jgi:RimJ/RimL family protein N-acetyltransferase